MPRRNKIFSPKVLFFLLCLLISSIVWLINKLTKEYSYEVPYRVCIYSSTNNIESLCANNLMYVRVAAKGFDIMKHRVNVKELNIDIKKTRLSVHTDEYNASEYVLPTSLIQNAVKEAISEEVRMEAIITDELSFNDNQ